MSLRTVLFKGFEFKSALRCLSSKANIKPVDLASTTYENENLKSTKAPFVIVHGLFGSKSNWTSLCKNYSKNIGKVIALDLRNHGESVHSDEHTYFHLVEDVRHFLAKKGIGKITLMGHSMGGRCAMLFALTYPEMLEKLIIVDISPSTASPQLIELPKMIHAMQSVKMPENVSLHQARTMVDQQLVKAFPNKDVRTFILTNLIAKENSFKWRINVPVLEQSFNNVATFPKLDATFNGETLFIGGGISDFIPNKTPKHKTSNSKMTLNFCKLKPFRCMKTTIRRYLAQNQNYKNVGDLAYASFQSADGAFGNKSTPVLVIHGLLGSMSNFYTLCKRYHESTKPKRIVYAIDLRNHGDSPHFKTNSYDDLVMDVVKFLTTMNLEKVSLLGHDIGGRVGMLIGLKYPELVEKLIISDMSPITTSHSFNVIPAILKTLSHINFPPNLSFPLAKAHTVNCLSRIVRNKDQMSLVLMNLIQRSDGSYSWRFNKKALLENFEELSAFPDVHNVKFEQPALFVGGGKSDYLQKSDFPKIQKLFPKAELKYIEGAGHWVHAEKPNEFLKLTLDFLNKP